MMYAGPNPSGPFDESAECVCHQASGDSPDCPYHFPKPALTPIKQYMQEQHDKARKLGKVISISGRERMIR